MALQLLDSSRSFWLAVVAVSLLKLLLINSYRSTDFEVHRNWLAITHSLPLEEWYYEKTSEWTLDYPPFFAYFEWSLSQIAKYFDADMLEVDNADYASSNTVLFQRLSVIVVDLLLAYAVLRCSKSVSVIEKTSRGKPRENSKPLEALFVLIFLNGGLLMVDHIHFQYNGFLFGILLLSIAYILEGKYYTGAFVFAALLNFKHIFLYMAPAVGIYLLRRKVFPPNAEIKLSSVLISLASFAGIGISVIAASFGPFYQHIPQIISRLFPFERGLSHAYWAPNFWAIYNTLDWILNLVLKTGKSSVTSGLVGEATFSYLPNVPPKCAFLLTIGVMTLAIIKIWKAPTENNFIRGIVIASWTSFMFGYHVHEKAILNVIIPFSLIAMQEPYLYFMTLVSGTVSLFPLLFTPFEIALKAIIAVLHFTLAIKVLPSIRLYWLERIYLGGFVLLFIVENFGNTLLPKLPFLPLMLVSDYTLLGNMGCYVLFYWKFWSSPDMKTTTKPRKSQSPVKAQTPVKTQSPAVKSESPKSVNISVLRDSPKSELSSTKKGIMKQKKSLTVTPAEPTTTTRVLRKRPR